MDRRINDPVAVAAVPWLWLTRTPCNAPHEQESYSRPAAMRCKYASSKMGLGLVPISTERKNHDLFIDKSAA
jgi:hypothetical protein